MLDREQLIEIGVAVSAVLVMIGAMVAIGTTYSTDGGLSEQGGTVLVGVIAGFILLMTGVGFALAYVLNEPEDAERENAA
ncbi:DUF7472 family protein [Salinilacihabitans rarus]|uniref:DUF7472 family protein n=1 Tax=Salinilacihabitans rarus TaxID=2961596 RepID=UPI0020C8AEEB|nr:hypothetical protein [Salinilacihabitans rarus]